MTHADAKTNNNHVNLVTPSKRNPHQIHCAIGHSGFKRMHSSNLIIDGIKLSDVSHNPLTCRGCRLGNTGNRLNRHKSTKPGDSTTGFTHFGQQIESDMCTGFEPSFPHHFISMFNFKDRYTTESFLYYGRSAASHEVASSLEHFEHSVKHRLKVAGSGLG